MSGRAASGGGGVVMALRNGGGGSSSSADGSSISSYPKTSVQRQRVIQPQAQAQSQRYHNHKNRSSPMVTGGKAWSVSSASSPPTLPALESVNSNGGGGGGGLDGWVKAKKETQNVWMCSLCGMAFRSLAQAEHHEACCIREAFSPVGTDVDDETTDGAAPASLQVAAAVGATSFAAEEVLFPHDTSLQQQQRQQELTPLEWNAGGSVGETSPPPQLGNGSGGVGRWKIHRSATTPSSVFRDFFFPTTASQQPASTIAGANKGSTTTGTAATTTTTPISPPAPTPLSLSSSQALPLDNGIRQYMLLTDDALCKVVRRASSYVLTAPERDAERHLALWSRDRVYYDTKSRKRRSKVVHYKSAATGLLAKLQTKFTKAYELIKEGEYHDDSEHRDDGDDDGHAGRQQRAVVARGGAATGSRANTNDSAAGSTTNNPPKGREFRHDESTLFVNVVVKHSAKVVRNELERLAQQIWNTSNSSSINQFERFRTMARANMVKLAGLALASDFTPRRVAGQLSNDLHRLMVPELKLRGVDIETEIEYRMGPFFVLSVNILRINWVVLMRHTHRDFVRRKRRWMRQKEEQEQEQSSSSTKQKQQQQKQQQSWLSRLRLLLSNFDVLAQCLAWLNHVHWVLSVPLCTLLYSLFLGKAVRKFILTSVTDDIYRYVEKKGMEMDLGVLEASHQAAFMLAALRELRQDERTKSKAANAAAADDEAATDDDLDLLGPFLGPAIAEDAQPASIPDGFEVPESLEFVNLEMDLPVGFRRLRWAFLHKDSQFFRRVIFETEAHYENITIGEWSIHNDAIGLPNLPEGLSNEDFVGAQKESSYLMPKSVFVKANMAYEEVTLTVYNDYCFAIKKKTRTPDVPYGSTFLAWTQYVVTDKGPNQCRMVCSVEAEFPNGPPLVGRQIKSGMRAGTAELFLLTGETICKYAHAFPTAAS